MWASFRSGRGSQRITQQGSLPAFCAHENATAIGAVANGLGLRQQERQEVGRLAGQRVAPGFAGMAGKMSTET